MWFFMDSHTKSRWLGICAEIAVCEDAQRLAELQIEIMTILHEQERRLEQPKLLQLRR